MAVIQLENVSRAFTVSSRTGLRRRTRREIRAVDDLSFAVEAGEVVGYIGPNGAGKSTTIKMLTGILVPTGGEIRVAGIDPSRYRLRLAGRIGVVFGQRTTLWWDLPLKDSFDVLHKMYGVPRARYTSNLADFVELLDLGDLLDVPVRQLSLGQRMRGDIAAALLHDPEIVYLDEPTIGLDIVSKARLREFLARINSERRTTIVLTTHDLDDIEALCSRVMVIDHGHKVYDGTLAGLRASQGRPANPCGGPGFFAGPDRHRRRHGGEGGRPPPVALVPRRRVRGSAGGAGGGPLSPGRPVRGRTIHRRRHSPHLRPHTCVKWPSARGRPRMWDRSATAVAGAGGTRARTHTESGVPHRSRCAIHEVSPPSAHRLAGTVTSSGVRTNRLVLIGGARMGSGVDVWTHTVWCGLRSGVGSRSEASIGDSSWAACRSVFVTERSPRADRERKGA
jgi:viologen exporter family transport system ATP-binding protein